MTARFAGSGDKRALYFLYPYLNHAEKKGKRVQAISVAARVFEGCGPGVAEDLDYFTRNTDSFIQDRTVAVLGAAVAGWPEEVMLETLRPYLESRNRFVQRLAMTALSKAAEGTASPSLLAAIKNRCVIESSVAASAKTFVSHANWSSIT